jgi:pimeloyl-ACP methyl ester carboxylesterase
MAIFKEDKITVPVQVLLANAPFWNDDYEAFVRRLIPHLDYRKIDGAGHFLMIDKPAAFNQALAEFLTKEKILN